MHTYVYIAYKQYAVFDMCTNMMRERERLIQEQNYLQKIQKIMHYVQFSKLSSDKWYMGLPGGSVVKNLPAVQETWVGSLGWEDPLEEGIVTTPAFFPGEPHGQQSLAGYSAQGHTDLDTTEAIQHTYER